MSGSVSASRSGSGAPSRDPNAGSGSAGGLSVGGIVGIVIAALILIGLIVAFLIFLKPGNRRHSDYELDPHTDVYRMEKHIPGLNGEESFDGDAFSAVGDFAESLDTQYGRYGEGSDSGLLS
jgi:hypothetical protein